MKKTGWSLKLAIFCLSFCLCLLVLYPTAGVAGSNGLRRLSGSAFFERGYSVYAAAEETSAGTFSIRVAIQFAPNYVTNDGIVAYQLRLSNGTVIDVPAENQQQLAAPSSFHTTTTLDEPLAAIQVVPVLDRGGSYGAEAFSITQPTNNWDAIIGTLATVRNSKSTSRLNLRYAPSEDAEVWMQYYNGTPLIITNILPNDWVAVVIAADATDNGTRGYMKANYLAFGNDSAQVQPAMPTYRAVADFILYSAPNEASQVLATYNKNADILVMGVSTTWYHVEVDGVVGYVKISAVNSAAAPNQPSKPSQTATPNQPFGSNQPTQPVAKLRTYSEKQNTGYGYTVDAVVTEVSGGQFIVNVNIQLPQDFMNDVVVAYNLYVNGAFAVSADRVQQSIEAPTRFKGSFPFSGAITSLQLIPVTEKGGENTNDSECVNFSVK